MEKDRNLTLNQRQNSTKKIKGLRLTKNTCEIEWDSNDNILRKLFEKL